MRKSRTFAIHLGTTFQSHLLPFLHLLRNHRDFNSIVHKATAGYGILALVLAALEPVGTSFIDFYERTTV